MLLPTSGNAETLDIQSLENLIAEKQYSDALIKIQELRQNPDYVHSAELIYNLGLSEWHLEQFGPALAHFRLALHLKPLSMQNIKTLSWAERTLEDIQKLSLRSEPFRSSVSLYVKPIYLFALSLLALAVAAFNASRNKGAGLREKFRGLAPLFGLSVLAFLGFLFLNGQTQRLFATLVASDSVIAHAAASEKSADIGILHPGDAVEVIKKTDDWWQVQASAIPSGWVKATNLKIHNRLD